MTGLPCYYAEDGSTIHRGGCGECPDPLAGADEAPDLRETLEAACKVMHNAYEAAAVENGWETQERSRKAWADVPEANKATMRVAVQAVLDFVAADAAAAARAEDRMGTIDGEKCHRCGGENVAWSAPSPLWNLVIRGNDINGDPRHDDLVCMRCFVVLADEAGVSGQWRLCLADEPDGLVKVTPSGRVWNPETWMWDEPGETPPARADLTAAVEALCDDVEGRDWSPTTGDVMRYFTGRLRAVLAESRWTP